jgi:hypothetical protein
MVQIGMSKDKVTVTDSETEFGVNGVIVKKTELGELCGCSPNGKCWAIPFSTLGWPEALRLCQQPGEPGHEKFDSEKHRFTQEQLTKIATLIAATKAAAQE